MGKVLMGKVMPEDSRVTSIGEAESWRGAAARPTAGGGGGISSFPRRAPTGPPPAHAAPPERRWSRPRGCARGGVAFLRHDRSPPRPPFSWRAAPRHDPPPRR